MFEWPEHAWATHDPGAIELLKDHFLHAYTDDPRFIAFPQKVGVMPKAAATHKRRSIVLRRSSRGKFDKDL